MINWKYYPANKNCPDELTPIIKTFEKHESAISSDNLERLKSNEVLAKIGIDLETYGFKVEKSKSSDDKIKVPVLFGHNGRITLSFDADAYNPKTKVVLEVEAGRAVTNYQFLKDFFQACMMQDVNFFCVAVRNKYLKRNDFKQVIKFFDALFASGKLSVPFEGILILGY